MVITSWHGLAHQSGVYMPSICGFCGGSANVRNRTHVGICDLNSVSMSAKGQTFFGSIHLRAPHMCLLLVPTRIENLLGVSEAIAGNKSGLVYQENEETGLAEMEKDELDLDLFGQHLPPWGNVGNDQGSDTYSETAAEPSSILRHSITVNESKVCFLEETDEEKLSSRILMLSRSNKVRSALELFRSMEFLHLRINGHACNSLLSSLLRHKLLDNAMDVLEFMKTNGITTGHTYSIILKAIASAQSCDSALNMFAEMEGSSEKKKFDIIVYNTMISVCGRANNWVETERIWKSLKANGHCGTQVTYELLICTFVRCGQYKLALDAYGEMVKNGLEPRDDTLNAVIGACSKEGKWNLALNLIQNMLNCRQKPNLIACNALINSLGRAGKVQLAFRAFKIVKSLGHTPDAYTWYALISSLYRINQHHCALQLFESIKRGQISQMSENVYHLALMSCQKLKLWDKALQILWQMEASGMPVSTATYNLVIGACEIARKLDVALQVYEHMVHQNCTPDMFSYLSLIRSCIRASLWGEMEEILDVAPNSSAYHAAIKAMCLNGKVGLAKKLYVKMPRSALGHNGKGSLES
uniref:Pentatricopeptide repeat-containing protein-mitochondrial domain-containing protein n=1 Tax=Rhizophora mucronata TaxID=61149 RepID=A0A2P2NG01_RHIMU